MTSASESPASEPPRRRRTLALAGVAIVAVVLISAVLLQVLYGVFSGPPQNPGPQRITATFGSPDAITDGFQVTVTNVSQALGPAYFKVNLTVNSMAGTPAALAATVALPVNGTSYTIRWVDVGGEGTLSIADRFQVTRSGGLPISTGFTFSLLWSDSSVIRTAQYTTASRPIVTFGSPIAVPNGFDFSVTGVSRSVGPGNYTVNLEVNSTTGTPVSLAPNMSLVVGGQTYSISWTDIGGEGLLNAGDRFRVTASGGLPASTVFTFLLLWSDGSVIQTITYTT